MRIDPRNGEPPARGPGEPSKSPLANRVVHRDPQASLGIEVRLAQPSASGSLAGRVSVGDPKKPS